MGQSTPSQPSCCPHNTSCYVFSYYYRIYETIRRYIKRDFLQEIGLHKCGGRWGIPEIQGSGRQEWGSPHVRVELLSMGRCFCLQQGSLGSVLRALQLMRSGPPRLSENPFYLTSADCGLQSLLQHILTAAPTLLLIEHLGL